MMIAHNCTQATGVDLLTHGVLEAERRGFDPFFVVHDQCLAPEHGDISDMISALCDVPEWFKGFPLEADGDIALSYSKA